jgi:hypothetical protein
LASTDVGIESPLIPKTVPEHQPDTLVPGRVTRHLDLGERDQGGAVPDMTDTGTRNCPQPSNPGAPMVSPMTSRTVNVSVEGYLTGTLSST